MNKPLISIIVAHTKNRAIGRNNAMPWHLPRDLRWFKQHTQGQTVIMGKNTFWAIGKALPNRFNIVLTSDADFEAPQVERASSLSEAISKAQRAGKNIFIIGGAQLYRSSIALADQLIITHIDTEIADGDAFFPDIGSKDWQLVSEEYAPADERNAFDLRFCVYRRSALSD